MITPNEKENMSNKPKEKTQARKTAKALGVRFTDEEIAAMSEEIGMAPGEIPDATVVGTFVRRKLRDGRKAR